MTSNNYSLENTVHTGGLHENVNHRPRLAGRVGVDLSNEGSSTVGVDLVDTHGEGTVGGDGRDTAERLRDSGHRGGDVDGAGEESGTAIIGAYERDDIPEEMIHVL